MTEDERSEFNANRNILASVNDAINRAGIHCAITFAEAIDRIALERDNAREELKALRRSIKDAF